MSAIPFKEGASHFLAVLERAAEERKRTRALAATSVKKEGQLRLIQGSKQGEERDQVRFAEDNPRNAA